MANPNIRIKRSSVEGKRPSLSQVDLGELAVNTNDGRLFTRKENVGIGSTVTLLNPWTENIGGGVYYTEGNVGIGTFDNPSLRLDIDGNVRIKKPSGGGGIIFLDENSTGSTEIYLDSYFTNYVQSNTSDGITIASNDKILLQNSNVGIGTTNPTEKLDVNGNIKADNFYKGTTPLITGVGISSNSSRVSTAITDFNFVGAEVTAGLTTATVTIVKVLTIGRKEDAAVTINAVGTGITMLLRSGSVATLTF